MRSITPPNLAAITVPLLVVIASSPKRFVRPVEGGRLANILGNDTLIRRKAKDWLRKHPLIKRRLARWPESSSGVDLVSAAAAAIGNATARDETLRLVRDMSNDAKAKSLLPNGGEGSRLATFFDVRWEHVARGPGRGGKRRNDCVPPDDKGFSDYHIERLGGLEIFEVLALNVALLPLQKIIFDSNLSDEYFGRSGGATNRVEHVHTRIQRFWSLTNDMRANDPEKEDLALKGMHGVNIADLDKLFLVLTSLVGLDEFTAFLVVIITSIVLILIGDEVNSPLFTYNAVAVRSFDMEYSVPYQMIWGDGIIELGQWLDLDYAIEAVHAHEYAHHIFYVMGWDNEAVGSAEDFGLGLDEDGDLDADSDGMTPDIEESISEKTRRFELMADYFSGYYNAHPCGENLRTGEICDVYETFYGTGDCDFTSIGHHGSPAQRECAAIAGAMEAYSGGGASITEPTALRRRFNNILRGILSVEAKVCPHPDTPEGRAAVKFGVCPLDMDALDGCRDECVSEWNIAAVGALKGVVAGEEAKGSLSGSKGGTFASKGRSGSKERAGGRQVEPNLFGQAATNYTVKLSKGRHGEKSSKGHGSRKS